MAMAPLPRTILAERVSVAGDEHNADFPPAITRSPFGDRLSGESGDTLGLPTMAFPSESMLGYLDRLKECGCITPLLQRIRGLQQSLRERLEAEEKLQAKSDAQDDHCQRLKDRLAEWSQATSFFEEQKCKLGAQLHRAEFERDRANQKVREKEEQLAAMKLRLQNREGDFKTEVEKVEALRLELTHAEARARQAEEWAETTKRKAEQDRRAKEEADKLRADEFQRAERLHMDLIEARRLHADDEAVKRLRADKDAADIQLKHTREELNAITSEYKRLAATKNAKDKPSYQDLAERMTKMLKKNEGLEKELNQLRCQANDQINDLHKDKNNVNGELHLVQRQLSQAQSTITDLKAANAMLKNELGITKRDTIDLRSKLDELTKQRTEENFKQRLTLDKMKEVLARARQEIIALKAKMAGYVTRADQLQELASRRALDLVEMRAESEKKLMECTGSMIHSTEELHGQIELLKGALLKKAEELQTLKEIHQNCPGAGPVSLQPIGVRLGPDGKFTAIPQQEQQQQQQDSGDGDKSYTQSEMDQVIDMLEAKLLSMQSDNERLKDIIKEYDCCCADQANEENAVLQKALETSQEERQHLRQMAQLLLQTKNFLSSGINAAIEERFGGARDNISDAFIERIDGVRRICRFYELEDVRSRLQQLGVPQSLVDQVIDEGDEEDVDGEPIQIKDAEEHLNDLFDLFSTGMDGENSDQKIEKLSKELEHYKHLEQRLSDSQDVEHGIAKNVVKRIKAEVIEALDAPLEELEEFKTFLWQHESLFDERAFQTNRDLTAAIREELSKETGELHKMLQDLKHKLLDLRGSVGRGGRGWRAGEAGEDDLDELTRESTLLKQLADGNLSEVFDSIRQKVLKELGMGDKTASEIGRMVEEKKQMDEMRRKSDLLKQLADGDLSEEERQKVLEELGLQHLSEGALQEALEKEREQLARDKEQLAKEQAKNEEIQRQKERMDEMRRKSDLLKQLADGDLSEEERQKVLEELGLQHLSEGALQEALEREKEQLARDKEQLAKEQAENEEIRRKSELLRQLAEGKLSDEERQRVLQELGMDKDFNAETSIKTIYDHIPSTESGLHTHVNNLLGRDSIDSKTKEELRKMLEDGASPADIQQRLARLKHQYMAAESYVQNEAKKMMEELKTRWEDGDITDEEVEALQGTLAAPNLTSEELLELHKQISDGPLHPTQRKDILKALPGEDREGLRQMLLGENPRGRQTPKLTQEAQLAALLHDDKHTSEDQRQKLQSQLEAIQNDETLTEDQKKEMITSLVNEQIREARRRSIESIENDSTLSEEEKKRKIQNLMEDHVEDSRTRAMEKILNDPTLTEEEKQKKIEAMHEMSDDERRHSLDLIHKEGSLTSQEKVRLQKRLDQDWVLTDNERERIGDRLKVDDERRELAKIASERNSTERRGSDIAGGGVSGPSGGGGGRGGLGATSESAIPGQMQGMDGRAAESEDDRLLYDSNHEERLRRAEEQRRGREGSQERRSREARHSGRGGGGGGGKGKGDGGGVRSWIGYFNRMAGILPDPEEVSMDDPSADGSNHNDNRGSHRRHSDNSERRHRDQDLATHADQSRRREKSARRRYYEKLNQEVTSLESDPVIQLLRQQKELRQQQQQSRQDKENRAGTNDADEKTRRVSRHRGRTLEERISDLRQKISSHSDVRASARLSYETPPLLRRRN